MTIAGNVCTYINRRRENRRLDTVGHHVRQPQDVGPAAGIRRDQRQTRKPGKGLRLESGTVGRRR